jgi:2-polyprenyl-6-methoxyphenol hydroxylase-like FAD-dependent oxidoreductase
MKIKIAIVGGGPVGLTTAINLIYNQGFGEKNNTYCITVYEKRKKYTR